MGDDEPTTFESHIIRVRLDRKRVEPRFYYYLFRVKVWLYARAWLMRFSLGFCMLARTRSRNPT